MWYGLVARSAAGECMWYVVTPFSLQSNTICGGVGGGGGVGFVRTARRAGQNKSQSKYPKLKFRPPFRSCLVVSSPFFAFFRFLLCFCTATLQQ